MLNSKHFQHPYCANFSVPMLLTTTITIGFSIPVAAQNSLVTIGWSFQIGASTLSLFSIVAAVVGQLLQGPSHGSYSNQPNI